jgi:hypothetical protein
MNIWLLAMGIDMTIQSGFPGAIPPFPDASVYD